MWLPTLHMYINPHIHRPWYTHSSFIDLTLDLFQLVLYKYFQQRCIVSHLICSELPYHIVCWIVGVTCGFSFLRAPLHSRPCWRSILLTLTRARYICCKGSPGTYKGNDILFFCNELFENRNRIANYDRLAGELSAGSEECSFRLSREKTCRVQWPNPILLMIHRSLHAFIVCSCLLYIGNFQSFTDYCNLHWAILLLCAICSTLLPAWGSGRQPTAFARDLCASCLLLPNYLNYHEQITNILAQIPVAH